MKASAPTSGQRYMRARVTLKAALTALNDLWSSGDIVVFQPDSIERLISAREALMTTRYPKPLRSGAINRCHGGRDC